MENLFRFPLIRLKESALQFSRFTVRADDDFSMTQHPTEQTFRSSLTGGRKVEN